MMRAPVLFLAFNRPALLRRVLEAVQAGGPREIFIAVDGPRKGREGEVALCTETVAVARSANWATKLNLKIEPFNLGCGPAVRSAIDWAFGHAPELIIIEDDCLPDPSFLRFCDEMLERYRDDPRVMQIGGTHWGAAAKRFNGHSYAFTSFAPIWGWASWRRAWQLYDYELASWPALKSSGGNKKIDVSTRFRKLLERDWDMVREGCGTWDHQWQYTVLRHRGLSICAEKNLVVNLGFKDGVEGTHHKGSDRIFSRLPLEALDFPLRHPPQVARSKAVEAVFEQIYWQKLGWPAQIFRRLVRNPRLNELLRRAWRNLLPRPA